MKSAPLFVVACLATLITGCGTDKPADLPELQAVTIKVTHGGAAVPNATLSMSPEEGKWAANGTTDAQGVATLRTNGKYDGVVAGKYTVSVNKMSTADDPDPAEGIDFESMTHEEAQAAFNAAKKEATSLIPDHLTIASKSPIEVDIPAGGAELTIEIDDYPEGK